MTVPFPGESIGCRDAWSSDAAADDLYLDVWKRGPAFPDDATIAGHREITAGIEWRCWAYSRDRPYLEAADDATPLTVAWVLEVLSGSGVLALSDFHDAAWGYDTALDLPNDLGEVTVPGPGTYTVPTSSFPNSVIREAGWETGAMEVRIRCTSGAVDVQQVKLRAMPVGGPLGGWSDLYVDDPGETRTPDVYWQGVGSTVPPDTNQGYSSQGLFRSAMASLVYAMAPQRFFAGESTTRLSEGNFQAIRYTNTLPDSVTGAPTDGWVHRNEIGLEYSPPGAEGVDWVRSPFEVQGDEPDVLFQPTQPPTVTWVQPTVSGVYGTAGIIEDPSVVPQVAGGALHVLYEEADALPAQEDAWAPPASTLLTLADPFPAESIPVSFALPEVASGRLLRITTIHDGFNAAQPYSSGALMTFYPGDGSGGSYAPLQWHWQPGPYSYWVPGPAASTAPVPRQWRARPDGLAMSSAPSWRRSRDTVHDGQWRGVV